MQAIETAKELGRNLRTIREDRELTQRDVADTLEISRAAYAGWESGHRLPNVFRLIELAELFQVPVLWMLSSRLEGDRLPTPAAWDAYLPDAEPIVMADSPCILSF